MASKTKSLISLALLLLLWSLALPVRAAWTAPPALPPSCPAGAAGCDAPINVSTTTQIKAGGFVAGVMRSFSDLIVDHDLLVTGATTLGTGLVTSGPATSTTVHATSLTASSTFANGINLSKGCFAINGVCISGGGGGGGGSSQWSNSGSNIYFSGGAVGVGDGYSFGSASSSALAYYLPYNANPTTPKGEISFRSTATTGQGSFNIGGYYNIGSGWNYRNFMTFDHNGNYPSITVSQPTYFNSDLLMGSGTTLNASAADALVAPSIIYDPSVNNFITVGDPDLYMSLYSGSGTSIFSSGIVSVSMTGGSDISVGSDVVIDTPAGRNARFTGGNVGIGATAPAYLLDVGTTTSGRIGVGGTQVVYKPDQTNFLGSLIYGDGGGKLTHGSGSEGYHNSIFGILAGNLLTTGADNTIYGWRAGRANQTGNGNTAFGAQALEVNTAGANTAFGWGVLGGNTTGTNNTGIGVNSLGNNQTGSDNVGIGVNTLRLGNGNYNMAIGTEALNTNKTGGQNVGIGYRSSYQNISATNTIAIGYQAARGASSFNAQGYTAIGYQALTAMITGANNNTAIGASAGGAVSSGANNVLLGYQAGDAITTGSNNIVIGYDIDAPSDTGSNQLTIGNLIFGTGLTATAKTVSTGKVGIGIAAPATTLDVNGLVRAYQTSTTTCDASVEGAFFYNGTAGNKHFYGCNGSTWRQLDN